MKVFLKLEMFLPTARYFFLRWPMFFDETMFIYFI